MKRVKFPTFVTIAALLAACVQSGTTAPLTVGTADPDPAFVARVFDEVCIATLPDYAGAIAALTELGFAVGPSGTFYNGRDDLSVKLIDGDPKKCSVVWAVEANHEQSLIGFRNAMMAREPLDLSTAQFDRPRRLGGQIYFNVRTAAK